MLVNRVAIIQRLVPHYRVPFFKKLSEELEKEEIQLELYYSSTPDYFRPRGCQLDEGFATYVKSLWWRFRNKSISFQFLPIFKILQANVIVVEHSLNSPAVFILFLLRRFGRAQSLILWCHGGFSGQPSRSVLLRAIDSFLSNRCQGVFFYTDRSFEKVGHKFREKRQYIVNNTILGPANATHLLKEMESRDISRDQFRCVFIGGLNASKRPDLLASIIEKTDRNIEFDIIGDGEELARLKSRLEDRENVTFWGHLEGESKEAILKSAHLMLMPGMVGLACVDCMYFGLPTLTSNMDIHSPEVSYLKHGENALFVDDASFSTEIERLAGDRVALAHLRINCLSAVKNLTMDRMVSNFKKGVMRELHASN